MLGSSVIDNMFSVLSLSLFPFVDIFSKQQDMHHCCSYHHFEWPFHPTNCAPPLCTFSSRDPPNMVFQWGTVAVRAQVRHCDSSLSSDWRDDAPQVVRASEHDLLHTAHLLLPRPVCGEHACARCQDQTGALHMFYDTSESESCLVKAPAKHASESVLVVGKLLCTGAQANTERHTRKETREMCSCWGYKQHCATFSKASSKTLTVCGALIGPCISTHRVAHHRQCSVHSAEPHQTLFFEHLSDRSST